MYALLDTDNKTVIAVFTPDVPYEKILEEANGRTLIALTPENSPAYINGTYENGKFYTQSKNFNNGGSGGRNA
jgi:hypothetical protein